MNRKYYFNNMWWGWVTGGYMLYMSWDYDFKYRLLFWCISLCGMVLYPVAKCTTHRFPFRFHRLNVGLLARALRNTRTGTSRRKLSHSMWLIRTH